MKKILLLSFAIFLIAFFPLVIAGELKPELTEIIAKTPATEKIPVIILFHEKPTPSDISIIQSDGASIKYQYTIIDAVAATVPAQAVEKIAKRAFVKLVEPDYKVKLVLDKSIPQIQADKVWEAGITGKDVDIAVLDTGIHDEHPSLTIEKEVDFTGEGTDDLHGHGTHVAGIIASTDSTYRGVAYGADLFNVKVLNKDGSGYGSDVIKGIEWSVDNGAEIISMSLGAEVDPCDGTDAISQAVDKAVNKGVVVVVAAGNSGPDAGTITSPGCSKKGITVGAVDDNDNVPSWSSRGPTDDGRVKPDLVAPGVGITSTWLTDFKSLSGTSMSTPHVSGVAALLLEVNPSLKPDDIKEVLKSTALDLGLDENTQGAGRLDAYEAYIYVANATKEPENETEENKTKETPPGFEKRKKIELPPAFEKGLPAVGITPDSWMYGFKRFFEGIDLFFTFDDVAKAEKHLKYAELRLAEAKEMAEKGKPEFVDDLIEEYEDNLEKANEISKIAQQLGKNVTKVTELVAVATSIHVDVLENVLEKVPEQAKSSIQRAITSSKRGNEEALKVLEKAQPEKAAEIHFRIAEKRLAKVQEKVNKGEIEDVGDLIEEYEERINKSNRIAEIAKGLGNNTTNVEQLIAEATSTHLEILSEVHENVPEQAKQAIEKAMDVSSKGREKAVEALKEKGALGGIPEKPLIPKEVKEKIPSIAKEKTHATIPEAPEEIEVEIPETPEQPEQPETPSTPTTKKEDLKII
ncbi:S8 family serine peptidase [Candidatus Woesearchaeota archaeon]|nr:S8 family serine peptidase [Candidatus Woesearchaeota archaeon]